MADSLSLAGSTFESIATAKGVPWTNGSYYAVPPLGQPPLEHSEEFEEMPVAFPGVGGVGIKNLGFRGQDIDLELIFINATQVAIESAFNSLMNALTETRFSVTVPGGTAHTTNVELKRGGMRKERWFNIGGKLGLLVSLALRKMEDD